MNRQIRSLVLTVAALAVVLLLHLAPGSIQALSEGFCEFCSAYCPDSSPEDLEEECNFMCPEGDWHGHCIAPEMQKCIDQGPGMFEVECHSGPGGPAETL